MLAGARLLFGMGRDNALPKSFFGVLHPATRVPFYNVLLIGAICLVGSFLMSYQVGAELLNFGALIGFMGVNGASLLHYWIRSDKKELTHLVPPICGVLICFYLWISLSRIAQIAGAVWMLAGLLYGPGRQAGSGGACCALKLPLNRPQE